MDVDEAGHNHKAAPVNRPRGLPGKARSDVDDPIAVEGDVAVAPVEVFLAVEGDGPGGVPDEGDRHREALLVAKGTRRPAAAREMGCEPSAGI